MEKDDLDEILNFYNQGAEIGRLQRGIGKLEWERTQELISRYLPPQKSVIYDIGGGIGVYSSWLSHLGHEVHLFDFAPQQIEYAQKNHPGIYKAEVADARNINRASASADMVLLMGPLYHLTRRDDRLAAMAQAKRLLKPGGILIASVISRFSTTLWGLSDDPEAKARLLEIVRKVEQQESMHGISPHLLGVAFC